MTQVDVDTTAGGTLVVPSGNYKFIHIQVLTTDTYFKYDGSDTALTTSNGIKVTAGNFLNLNNNGTKNIFNHDIYGITASGTADIRVQGTDE